MDAGSMDMPELACPLCGYNLAVQMLHHRGRCSECGFILPEFDLEPQQTLAQRWAEMAEAVRRRNRRGFSDGLQIPWRGLGKSRSSETDG